jgi:cytochrome c5
MAATTLKALLFPAAGAVWMAAAALSLSCPAMARADDAAIEERYKRSCAVCHAAGAAGAPRTGAAEEWEPRLAKGMDSLVLSVEKGLNAMPPKGMCFDCTAEDYRALIEFMSAPR